METVFMEDSKIRDKDLSFFDRIKKAIPKAPGQWYSNIPGVIAEVERSGVLDYRVFLLQFMRYRNVRYIYAIFTAKLDKVAFRHINLVLNL